MEPAAENGEEDVSRNRKEGLLWHLYYDIGVLAFPPVMPYFSMSHHRYTTW